jgi:hypothetical protein
MYFKNILVIKTFISFGYVSRQICRVTEMQCGHRFPYKLGEDKYGLMRRDGDR